MGHFMKRELSALIERYAIRAHVAHVGSVVVPWTLPAEDVARTLNAAEDVFRSIPKD
jgi:hypothetical protein